MTLAGKLAATGALFLAPMVLGLFGMIVSDPGLTSSGDEVRYARWKRLVALSAATATLLGSAGAVLAVWSS
jgi:hypothetical protein